ncbi:Lrp/AsnC family transcriptional regulator [Amycolatopsis aidingensis]|uniref:Lrp/AsnC family transcriptional regulator n=1 Tax=Amycolatopsis aidingensis TaxID=2842453 RepID=UPI001C0B42B0|nr:Lrp/AsnC family transcriptional regulator [Amycolatopsis aidingensis]
MDDIDRRLLAALQEDATTSYAALGAAAGLSAGAAHERVRKLRERGVIRRTTVDIDPAAMDLDVLAFVLIDGATWMGDEPTSTALAAIPEVEEAHVVAGSASVLVKVRTTGTGALQDVLRRLYEVPGVSATEAVVALDTFFERPPWFHREAKG